MKKAPLLYVHPKKKKAQDKESHIVNNLRESYTIKKKSLLHMTATSLLNE